MSVQGCARGETACAAQEAELVIPPWFLTKEAQSGQLDSSDFVNSLQMAAMTIALAEGKEWEQTDFAQVVKAAKKNYVRLPMH